ncbi:hypothetical protein BCR44DRAFT_1426421 [Catenaria anguillulae PL171]|uniref:Uncharacterized protein n=1 Tax=Catenaria anguillulae PL171 TaxID=765915 RepID=A0A1Y2HXQ5_9FUNG|nr:hypothetical protein BCR44DRAFT_1426421 [Catenaria anguillulae PL171]
MSASPPPVSVRTSAASHFHWPPALGLGSLTSRIRGSHCFSCARAICSLSTPWLWRLQGLLPPP